MDFRIFGPCPGDAIKAAMVTEDVLTQHNLTESEYQKILAILKREPTMTELGIFSVMWSEHCSYKSSRVHLRRLPTKGPAVLQGPGENAGIIDIGDGLAVAFKIESHNHPSFIEPFQGAATGVGGILRDIFTMGARPIAAMNSLRFGPLDKQQTSGYWKVWSAELRFTETASGSRPSEERSTLLIVTLKIPW